MSLLRNPRTTLLPSSTARNRFTSASRAGLKPATPARDHHRLGQLLDLTIGGRRVIDHRQRVQVTHVGRQRHLAVVIQVAHPFVHRAPDHLLAPGTDPLPTDPELPRIVDHRLDPQHQTELVVHLQPVVLHPVFDPRPGPAILLAMSEHLTVEPRMPASVAPEDY